jgi:uncharacterized protein
MTERLRSIAAITPLVLLQAMPAAGQEPCPRQRLVSVNGTAEINVAPDEAILSVGFDSHDRELAAAKAQNDSRVKKALAVAHEAGIDEKDIQTSALSLGPNYCEEKIPKLFGYDASQTITLTLRGLSRYEALMTNLLQAGVNRVDGVQFRVSDPRKFKDEARSQAIRAAREKAAAMAAELGQSLGKPWEIAELGQEEPYAINAIQYSAGLRERNAFTIEQTPLASGQVSIRALVRISFQLE